jgi:hypothetical protein
MIVINMVLFSVNEVHGAVRRDLTGLENGPIDRSFFQDIPVDAIFTVYSLHSC